MLDKNKWILFIYAFVMVGNIFIYLTLQNLAIWCEKFIWPCCNIFHHVSYKFIFQTSRTAGRNFSRHL